MASYSGRESRSDLDTDSSDQDSDSHIMAAIQSRQNSTGASKLPPLGQRSNVPSSTPTTPSNPGDRTTLAATGSRGSFGSRSSKHGNSQQYELARPANWRQEIMERLRRVEQKQDRILSILQAKQQDPETTQTKSKVNVPNNIRVAVKDGYSNALLEGKQWLTEKPAGDGKTIFLRFDSAENMEMTTSIKTTVKGLYPAVNEIILKEEEMESDGEAYFAVKRVPWRSDELEEVLQDLDKKGLALKSAKAKKQECKRVRLEVDGEKGRPKSPTEDVMWALKH